MRNKEEAEIVKSIANFLTQHKILYRFDIQADLPLKPYIAKRLKETFKHDRGYPDLFIPYMRSGYGGLYVEIKVNSKKVFKKDGTLLKNEHLESQHKMHERLRNLGYKVEWGFGLVDSLEKIKKYINEEKNNV